MNENLNGLKNPELKKAKKTTKQTYKTKQKNTPLLSLKGH